LQVITGDGSIRLTGTGTAPAGMLNLRGSDVIVASLAAIDDVALATSTNAIETRLAQNDGFTSDEGSLFAGGITANVIDGFYVQNSGAGTGFAQRRGLTFGSLGLGITTASSTTRIVANGQQLGTNGAITGLDTLQVLTIGIGSASSSFDPGSTFNGCLIANAASCGAPVPPVPPSRPEIGHSFPVQDVVGSEEDDDKDPDDTGDGSGGITVPLIELRDIDSLPGAPLLDDPVTGAGNDDLWSAPAE
jgi:hypothetical protein